MSSPVVSDVTTDAGRAQLLELLDGVGAHMTFEDAVAEFPDDAIHLRLTQYDILEYVRNPDWVSPPWPIGYWPAPDAVATPEEFAATIQTFLSDRAALRGMVADRTTDLLA